MPGPAARLIYHPRRESRRFGETTVHYDGTTGNQDPYLWNAAFLHSFCHITQFRPEAGDINLWVSGDHWPQFSRLYCDLVFVAAGKYQWAEPNALSPDDPLVDSREAWVDHYRWYPEHCFRRRRTRVTLKADPVRSFQPQAADGSLIDIAPILEGHGTSTGRLRAGMRAGTSAQPMAIPQATATAIVEVLSLAPITLRGPELRAIRQRTPDLESPGSPRECGSVPGQQASRHRGRCGC